MGEHVVVYENFGLVVDLDLGLNKMEKKYNDKGVGDSTDKED